MSKAASDAQLVCRTLKGDYDAFAILVQRYQNMVHGVGYAYLHNFEDAQDLTQEVLIKAYRRLATYDPKYPFGPWLYTVAKRTTIDWLRSQAKTVKMEVITAEIIDTGPQPDIIAEKHEAENLLQKALQTLSTVNRETFCLYYVDGYSINEISQFLSVPGGTVKRRLHVSRKQLREGVMEMVKETFDRNRLTWNFTQDVVNKVAKLKTRLADYLPEEFSKLSLLLLTDKELKARHNELLRTLADVLCVDLEALSDESIRICTSELNTEQRDYLWQVLHELELTAIVRALRKGTIFASLIEDFQSVKVQIGRHNVPEMEKMHNHPYLRLFRENPDGSVGFSVENTMDCPG